MEKEGFVSLINKGNAPNGVDSTFRIALFGTIVFLILVGEQSSKGRIISINRIG